MDRNHWENEMATVILNNLDRALRTVYGQNCQDNDIVDKFGVTHSCAIGREFAVTRDGRYWEIIRHAHDCGRDRREERFPETCADLRTALANKAKRMRAAA